MDSSMSTQEQQLCQFLMGLAGRFSCRYTKQAADELLRSLFWCMAGGNPQFLDLLFPTTGGPLRGGTLRLGEAQGAVDGAEYTEAARGHACGHIFRSGEATYSCKTCGADDTCCLCSRCFEATDHRGHMVRISVSPGNSGCCDCGDAEAWKTPMFCTIHSARDAEHGEHAARPAKDKGKAVASTPPELEASIRMTVGRALDFLCDVLSCSPEQLRQPKTKESIQQDERMSRLAAAYAGGDTAPADEYAVLLWNDEKHTVTDVTNQVARACLTTKEEGMLRACETDEVGRSLLKHSSSIDTLLGVARILEDIKVTVTIRSSRDTFREQMCSTIIGWLGDIAGCSVGDDHHVLRRIVCEEMLRPWRKGSPAAHAVVGEHGMDDEERIAHDSDAAMNPVYDYEMELVRMRRATQDAQRIVGGDDDADDDGDDDDLGLDENDDDDDGFNGGNNDDDDDNDDDNGDADDDDDGDEDEMDEVIYAAVSLARRNQAGNDDVMMVDVQPDEGETADAAAATVRVDRGAWNPDDALRAVPAAGDAGGGGAGAESGDEDMYGTDPVDVVEDTMAVPPPPPPPPPHAPAEPWQLVPPQIENAAAAAATHTASAPPVPPHATLPAAAGLVAAAPARRPARERDVTPSDSDTAEPLIAPNLYAKTGLEIPKTPGNPAADAEKAPSPGRYWLGVPPAYMQNEGFPPAEDLFQRVRLDWLILFDLRLWKKVRNDLRSLYISTVVSIPEFKRVLGLRFAGLYTTLAQLYLIGDREPDHSIINISLQMLTTPSITAEVVERGNFLTTLMAILYTFLTTRQVGHPWDVSSNAVLAFDSGSVTNRRMYHFFIDLKYLFSSPHVQECLRTQDRYMMQFLDLVKLHQGICPNVRAIGEHVEYETDTWISASLITRDTNRLCRQFSDAFRNLHEADFVHLARAVRFVAKTVIINSIGAERQRFHQAEIRDELHFKVLSDFEFDQPAAFYDVVRFVVEEQPISFHHALHYTLSWLVECGKAMPVDQLRALLSFTAAELKAPPRSMGRKAMPRRDYSAEDYLMAAFDFPLRVCAWLAQMKAGMWVRNGISLRHQAVAYRGVSQRDVAHHRDIFLLQTALVVCDPSRVLASIVDRFGMVRWVKGIYEQKAEAQDDAQHLDVVEDMVHLLIVLVSDRTNLIETADAEDTQQLALRRDLVHVLCFKPLSYTEICNKLPDRFQDQERSQGVLEAMTTYKAPEGNADVGTFELKPEHIEEVDPYIAHYNKNQREESETAYRKWMAKKTGQPVDAVVYEPTLRPIPSGVFVGLSAFMATGVFAQLVYYSLLYPLVAERLTPSVPSTRSETFLQVVLHLVLIAVAEDTTTTHDEGPSFVRLALNQRARSNFMADAPEAMTIVALLNKIETKEAFKSCHAKIALILKRMRQNRPSEFEAAYARLGIPADRINMASPANADAANDEKERKKRAARARQEKVMAQFQEQQKSFIANQGDIDWGVVEDDDSDDGAGVGQDQDTNMAAASSAALPDEPKKLWKYPSGTCILCQEKTDERRLHGSFAFFAESLILRQTDLQDPDFVREAASTPRNLDRSADSIRPFGLAHENRQTMVNIGVDGAPFETERQTIGKGFPSRNCLAGTVSTGCGHIMHHHCFEAYFEATLRRHQQQIARHHPENTERLEFVCPLCKALGNAFLPIAWKGKEEAYPGVLSPGEPFAQFLDNHMAHTAFYVMGAPRPLDDVQDSQRRYILSSMLGGVADTAYQLISEAWELLPRPVTSQRIREAGMANLWPPLAAMLLAEVGGGGAPAAAGNAMTAAAAAATELGSQGGDGSNSSSSSSSSSMARDLVAAYRRLKKTLLANELPSRHSTLETDHAEDELLGSDTLAQAVGFSISAVEIQQRGTDAEYGMTLLTKIPEQTLTHLRVLCETVSSYIAVGSHRHAGDNRVESEYRRDSERQHCQLFMGQYIGEETENTRRPVDNYAPLLSLDPFLFLCECVFGVMPTHKIEPAHLVRLCYLAELVKVVYHMRRNIPVSAWINNVMSRQPGTARTAAKTTDGSVDSAALDGFAQFCMSLTTMDLAVRTGSGVPGGAAAGSGGSGSGNGGDDGPGGGLIDASLLASDALGSNRGFDQAGLDSLEGYYGFVQRYAVVFLRKCVVLLYAHGGVDFNSHVSPAPELGELERLTEALRLPSLDAMFTALTPEQGGMAHGWPAMVVRLVAGWVRHSYLHTQTQQRQEAVGGGAAAAREVAVALPPVEGRPGAKRPRRLMEVRMVRRAPPASAALSHPGIFELVGLPRQFDQLLEESTRSRCPTTGREVADPMICLLCGTVFCGQAICCLKEERVSRFGVRRKIGGAQQHMRGCQGTVGLFLNVRRCCVFYLHRLSGSFGYAPYMDQYGEVDLGFRHGRPLELNQRRYDAMLRAVWLGHGIPSFICRKLEMDINNGGWESV